MNSINSDGEIELPDGGLCIYRQGHAGDWARARREKLAARVLLTKFTHR